SADHAVRVVGKQDRATIGRQYTENDAGGGAYHGVRLWAFARIGGVDGDDLGRMHLMDRCEPFWRKAEPTGHPRPVFPDAAGIVIGTDADVQAGINAFGDAAVAGEEAMTYAACSMPFQGFALDRNRLVLHRQSASL